MEPMVRRFGIPADIPAEHGFDPPPVSLFVPGAMPRSEQEKALQVTRQGLQTLVGAAGFEREPSRLQSRCATRLRHAPTARILNRPPFSIQRLLFSTIFRKRQGAQMTRNGPRAAAWQATNQKNQTPPLVCHGPGKKRSAAPGRRARARTMRPAQMAEGDAALGQVIRRHPSDTLSPARMRMWRWRILPPV